MKFRFGNIPSGLAGCDVWTHKQKSDSSASDIKGCDLKEKKIAKQSTIQLWDKKQKIDSQKHHQSNADSFEYKAKVNGNQGLTGALSH